MYSDTAAASAGAAGLSVPLWFAHVDPFFQLIIASLGLFVLVLTVWNKWLEIKIKRATLEEAAHDETKTQ